jgi:hypothetical protein
MVERCAVAIGDVDLEGAEETARLIRPRAASVSSAAPMSRARMMFAASSTKR